MRWLLAYLFVPASHVARRSMCSRPPLEQVTIQGDDIDITEFGELSQTQIRLRRPPSIAVQHHPLGLTRGARSYRLSDPHPYTH